MAANLLSPSLSLQLQPKFSYPIVTKAIEVKSNGIAFWKIVHIKSTMDCRRIVSSPVGCHLTKKIALDNKSPGGVINTEEFGLFLSSILYKVWISQPATSNIACLIVSIEEFPMITLAYQKETNMNCRRIQIVILLILLYHISQLQLVRLQLQQILFWLFQVLEIAKINKFLYYTIENNDETCPQNFVYLYLPLTSMLRGFFTNTTDEKTF